MTVQERAADEEAFLARIETRLTNWRRLWNFFLVFHFCFGIAAVTLSAIAATSLVAAERRQLLSLLAAICVAVMAFVKPEPRYKNLVRAWRELEAQKTRYLFSDPQREPLI